MTKIDRRTFLETAAFAGAGFLAPKMTSAQSRETKPVSQATNITKSLLDKLTLNADLFLSSDKKRIAIMATKDQTTYGLSLPVNYDHNSVSVPSDFYIWSVRAYSSEGPLYIFDHGRSGKPDFVSRDTNAVTNYAKNLPGILVDNMPLEAKVEVENKFKDGIKALQEAVDKRVVEYIK